MNVIYPNLKFSKSLIPLDKSKVKTIYIHHTASNNTTVEDIHRWHLERGWNGIGYNEYIRKDGTVYIGRGDNIGAHLRGHNSQSYGIALEGNYDEEELPQFLADVVAERIKENQRKYTRAENVLPHKAHAQTNCPGKLFDMNKIYNAMSKTVNKENDHWAEKIFEELTKNFGVIIHEKRFDDNITRAEAMSLLLEGLKSIKNYMDSH